MPSSSCIPCHAHAMALHPRTRDWATPPPTTCPSATDDHLIAFSHLSDLSNILLVFSFLLPCHTTQGRQVNSQVAPSLEIHQPHLIICTSTADTPIHTPLLQPQPLTFKPKPIFPHSKAKSKQPSPKMTTTTRDPKILSSRLANKVAIVTGGGSGFGEAISKRFAEEGCKVIVADLDPVGGERVATYHEHSMHFVKMNVALEADWEAVVENTLGRWGRIDIVVNNAGTSYRNKVSLLVFGDVMVWDVRRGGRDGRELG